MKNLAQILPTPVEFNVTVLSGTDKGTVYRLMGSEIHIGRGSDNDIPIKEDPKCSRKHAVIRLTPKGFEIESLSEKNKMSIDGKASLKATLSDNQVIELGDTQLRFNVVHKAAPALAPVPQETGLSSPHISGAPSTWAPQQPAGFSSPYPGPPKRKAKQLNPIKIALYLIIGLMLYMILSDSPPPKPEVDIRTSEEITAEIEAANKFKESLILEREKNQVRTQAYQEAQAAYLRGFRDYRKGIFGRAMESFQACLSLVPTHTLCTRYLRLSQRRFNELVQYHMILGRKYKDQNQFSACTSAFSNVMVMVQDPTNRTYQEAKANYDVCQAQVEGRF